MERKFNSKIEELPIVAGYQLANLARDLKEFTDFSPKFDQSYLDEFENRIMEVQEVASPKLETQELKKITDRLYKTMDALIRPLDFIEGYLKIGKKEISISPKDFGTKPLKQDIRRRNAEGVIFHLQMVNTNVVKHKELLTAYGFSEEIMKILNDSVAPIQADNQLQYKIVSGRKMLVEQNKELFNNLYDQIIELGEIAKILFGKTDKLKASEYRFTNLLKSVRNVTRTPKVN